MQNEIMEDRIIYMEKADGTFVQTSRADQIINEMTPFLSDLSAEMKAKAAWKNQPSWSYRVKTKLNSIMRRELPMHMADAVKIGKKALFETYVEFVDLVTFVNQTAEFVPTKQDFCAYARMPIDAYNDIMANGTDDQREIIKEIDSYISDLQLQGAQGGIIKERSTEFRMTAQDFGHSIVKKPNVEEAADVLSQHMRSPEYWLKTFASMTPPTVSEKKAAVKKLKK